MNELALFAGAGGGILGGALLGWRTRCAVELDPYARRVLLARQRDGMLPRFPIWDDVTSFDGKPWRGHIDVISGGFPCQDISCAGKGAGITGKRSGLWGEMARIIGEVRPRYVFVENSPMLVRRGLAVVLGDLAALGYDARWCVLGADDAGAPHRRKRIWILAHAAEVRCCGRQVEVCNGREHLTRGQSCESGEAPTIRHPARNGEPTLPVDAKAPGVRALVADAGSNGPQGEQQTRTAAWTTNRPEHGGDQGWWSTEPDVGRVADGVASRVDRLKAIGNGQIPVVAAIAWTILRR